MQHETTLTTTCVCVFLRLFVYVYMCSRMYAYTCGGCMLPLPSPVYEREGTAVTTEKEKKA